MPWGTKEEPSKTKSATTEAEAGLAQQPSTQGAAEAFDWQAAGTGQLSSQQGEQTGQLGAGEKAPAQVDPMTKKYGLRPKKYAKLLDGERNDGDGHDAELAARERAFLAELPQVVAQLNKVAKEKNYPFRFSEAELATNFISEGGYFLFTPIQGQLLPDTDIDGFQVLGIDTFMQRKGELDKWMSPELRARSKDDTHAGHTENEKGEKVSYLNPATLEQGLEANAVMFAAARKHFSDDCLALGLKPQGAEAWFFWTTVYYNAGEGTGKRLLKKHGVDYWKQKWTLPDDAKKYDRSPKFNAAWRTSTWDSIRTAMGDDLRSEQKTETKQSETPAKEPAP